MKRDMDVTAAQRTIARRIGRLASVYRRRGYEVERDVAFEDGLRADLRVKKDDKTIVIAVKTLETLRQEGSPGTVELARRLAAMPGVRFDLVITAPRKRPKERSGP